MTPWPSRSATCPALLLCAVASLIGCVGGSSSNPGGGVGVGGDVFVPAGFDALSDGDGPGSLDTGAAATDGAATDTSARTTNDVPATPKDTAQLVGDGGCTLGAARCHDGKRQLCAKAGWSDTPCTLDAPVCVAGKCHVCAPGKPFCSQPLAGATHGMKAFSCSDDGATSTLTAVCKDGPCKDGQCMACFAGKHRCHEGQREVCAGGGLLWAPDHCPKSTPACVDGACKVCAPSSKSCGKDGAGDDAVVLCDDTGSKGTIVAVCKAPAFCESGACVQCKPGTAKCVDGALVTCKPDGTGFAVAPCPAAKPVCDGGTCKLCKADASFCQQATADAPAKVMSCGPKGDTAVPIKACGPGKVCHDSACKDCAPGTAECIGQTPLVCDKGGTSATEAPSCAAKGLLCGTSGCSCQPGPPFCAAPPPGLLSGRAVLVCELNGNASKKAADCADGQVCNEGKCQVCKPGALRCNGDKTLFCKANGSGWQQDEDCAAKGHSCVAGKCLDLCDPSAANPTNRGCRFWAVDLDNAKIQGGTGSNLDAQNAPYGVVITNDGSKSVSVTITFGPSASVPVAKTHTVNVAASSQASVILPPAAWKLPPASQDGTSLQGAAFRLDSTGPIAVAQHNPLQTNSFSADGSLLLPENALGTSYRAITRKQSLGNLRGFIAVVATAPGTTKISVTPTAHTLPGGAIPALKPGVAHEVAVQQGQVLNLETAGIGDDLTGTLVAANKRVAVFAGAEAAHAPDTDECKSNPAGGKTCNGTGKVCTIDGDCPQTCCADHLEAQLPPIARWGSVHVMARMQPRGVEPAIVRVVAAHNGTRVVVAPGSFGPIALQAGEHFELTTTADQVLQANKPVLVAQYMSSLGLTGKSIGDPAMAIVPPVEARLYRARIVAPSVYSSHFLAVAAPTGAEVKLDGKAQGKGAPIGALGWSVWRVPVPAGSHVIEGSDPIGAILHGWTKDGSYAHRAGAGGG